MQIADCRRMMQLLAFVSQPTTAPAFSESSQRGVAAVGTPLVLHWYSIGTPLAPPLVAPPFHRGLSSCRFAAMSSGKKTKKKKNAIHNWSRETETVCLDFMTSSHLGAQRPGFPACPRRAPKLCPRGHANFLDANAANPRSLAGHRRRPPGISVRSGITTWEARRQHPPLHQIFPVADATGLAHLVGLIRSPWLFGNNLSTPTGLQMVVCPACCMLLQLVTLVTLVTLW